MAPRETDHETHSTTDAADVELIERERWEKDVVAAGGDVIEWGTHRFRVELQLFADETAHLSVDAPSDPPPSAAEIVADLREPGTRRVAAILAREWGLDTSWFEDHRHEEVTA